MKRTMEQYQDAQLAESERNIDMRVDAIKSAARKGGGREFKQRELFRLTTGMSYTQYQAAMLVAIKRGDIVAQGNTAARRYTAKVTT